MANEADGEKGKVVDVPDQVQQVERAVVAPDGTITISNGEAKLKSVDIADVDLLLSFADGTFVIIPNGAIDATGDPMHPVLFTDQSDSAYNPNDPGSDNRSTLGELFQLVGISNHARSGSLRVVSGNVDAPKTLEEVEEPKPQGDESTASSDMSLSDEITAPAPMARVGSGSLLKGKGGGSGTGSHSADALDPVQPLATTRLTVYEPGHKTMTIAQVLASLGIEEPTVDQALYTSPYFKVTPSGRSDAPLGSYVAGETEGNLQLRSSPERQATREVINGTADNDAIDFNPAFSANPSQWVKTLHFSFNNFAQITSIEIVANTAISNIPGFDFQGAGVTRDGLTNHWIITPTADMLVNGLDIDVVYNVDDKAAPVDFNAEVTVSGTAESIPYSVTTNLNFSWREAATVKDFAVFSPSGTPVMILPRDGMGADIFAGDGDDVVHAGAGHDLVYGGSGNDTLDGGSGNDIIEGGAGADFIIGGPGIDTASYSQSASGLTVALDGVTGVANTGDAAGDTFIGIENLTGSEYNDILIGDSLANTLSGGSGDDILEGQGGADILDGGAGNDTASYIHADSAIRASLADPSSNTGYEAAGDTYIDIENLTGSSHNDILIGNGGANLLAGGNGDDILEGMAGADILDGGSGNNTASYEHSSVSVVASLTDTSANSGDALGDSYVNIQNLTGSAYNDTLTGDAFNNILAGGDGNDILEGMAGADILDGGAGNDTVSYANSGAWVSASLTDDTRNDGDAAGDTFINIENLVGSAFDDTLIGDALANILTGGAGNDILEGMSGADILNGGSGIDTASYAHAFSGVTVSLTNGYAAMQTGDAAGDTFIGIENLAGSAYADTLIGNAGSNALSGGSGDDILEGMAGADTLDGGAGSNTASYEHAAGSVIASLTDPSVNTGDALGDSYINIQNLTGSAYNDTLIGDAFDNTLIGSDGNDILEGMAGADALIGGGGMDTASYARATAGVTAALMGSMDALQAGDALGDTFVGIENLIGSSYDDTLIGNSGANILAGGDGNDTLEGMAGADTLDGGAGSNTASYEHALGSVVASLTNPAVNSGDAFGDNYINIQNLTGSAYNDTLIGNGGANTLTGGDGDDILEGMAGADTLIGGTGSNTASYEHALGSVVASLTDPSVNTGDALGDIYVNIQHLAGSAYNDTLIGDTLANTLTGGSGNDILEGMAGADTLVGGSGTDTATYAHATAGVTAALAAGLAALQTGDATGDIFSGIEHLTGSNYNDTLIGDSGSNTLSGGSGDDILEGMAGADTLDGGGGSNTASYEHAAGSVIASLTDSAVNGGDALGDTYSSIQHLTGSGYNDTLIGDALANTLSGGSGDDILEGMAGSDTLIGGTGSDTATYAHATAGVTATLTSGLAALQTGDATGDIFSGIEHLTGSNYNDTLIGDSGSNTLSGGSGDDILEGMAGADTLDGGGGSNTASYEHAAGSVIASLSNPAVNGGDALGDTYSNIQHLTGSVYADTLIGDALANTLSGGSGDDILEGMAGADILDGGSGSNTASYQHAAGAVVASLTNPAINSGDAFGDSYINIQHLSGSAYNDTLVGDSGNNALTGGDGNDTLEGMAGADILDGGAGSNTASYEHAAGSVIASLTDSAINGGDALGDSYANIQHLTGSTYNDTLIGDALANILTGGSGNDILQGMAGADTLVGGSGNDTATYADATAGVIATLTVGLAALQSGDALGDTFSSIENLTGSAYNDTLIGDSGSNTLIGSGGNDVLEGMAGADILDGGAGSNTASYEHAAGSVVASITDSSINNGDALGDIYINIQHLTGSAYNDMLVGDGSANILIGGDGNDILEGMAGADTLLGGAGSNTASYEHAAASVIASLANPSVNTGDALGDSYSGIQHLTGSAYNDTLIGDSNVNVLTGGLGNDLLDGGTGTAGDTLVGGAGDDTATYANATAGVIASLTASLAALQSGDATGDTFTDIENLIGSAYNDTLIGDALANTLTGGGGDDILEGMAGADILIGGAGSNTASYEHAAGSVIASLSDATANSGDALGDSYTNVQHLIGSAHNDTLVGDALANTLTGGDGNDILEGMGGADTLLGGAGSNTASYEHATASVVASLTDPSANSGDALGDTYTSIQHLTGSAYNDTLIGDSGNNILTGGDGDDFLEGMAGADALIGGAGSNTASYEHATASVIASLTNSAVNGGDALGDTYTNIQHLIGSAYNDTLIGNGSANTLSGGDGNDILEGMAGADILDGGAGSNTASYEHAAGSVIASLTNPAVNGGDALGDSYNNIQHLAGSAFNDTLIGNSLANTLTGGDGNDILEGMAGADTLIGGAGNNTASYEHAAIAVIASLANSSVNSGDALGDSYNSIQNLTGSAYSDTLTGDSNANVLTGGLGDDLLDGGAGTAGDTLVGGGGSDTATYANATAGITASLSISLASLQTGDATGDTFTGIENLIGTAYNDTLIGDSGSNVLSGGDGNDILEGMAGGDTLNGGAGSNTASYEHAATGVIASLTDPTINSGDALGDTYSNIQHLTGSIYNDTLIGNALANILTGGGGNDILEGMAGADTLIGGAGNNTASYEHAASDIIASLTDPTINSGDALGDTYTGIQNLTGSAYDDTLLGDSNANVLTGGLGDDLLDGGAGSAGDTLIGDGGTDTATYANATARVTASLTIDLAFLQTGDALGDTFSGIENLTGSAYNDTLIGDGSSNTLTGGDGDDILEGMAGADTLIGGNGSNTASYEHATARVTAALTTVFTAGSPVTPTGDAAGDVYANIKNLTGSAYNDTLIGDAANNTLVGGRGDDILEGMAGADALIGGTGSNTASYEHSTLGVTVSLANPLINTNDAAGDSYSNIQNLIGSSYGDTLLGNSGANNINGGGGFDTVTFATATSGITVSLTASLAYLQTGDAVGDTYTSIEKIIGTIYDDVLIGDSSNNELVGSGGNDVLEGMGGADALYGNAGNNTASYEHAPTGVVASLTNPAINTGHAAGDSFSNIQNLIGSGYNDTLIGDGAANVLTGGLGDDILDGLGGNDILRGGSGSDTIKANLGIDSAYGGDGNDTFHVSTAYLPTIIDGEARDAVVGDGNTVVLEGLVTGSYSMATLATKLNNIDTLNIKNASAGTALTISSVDIQNMVDNGSASQLHVKADSGDTLNVSLGAGETMTTTVIDATHTDYTVFNVSLVQVAQVHWNTA